jgi:uncharacterized membrane protein
MAALAYLLLPISGMLAYFSWGGPRVRFHGAQAVALGLVWSIFLFACSAVSVVATQVVFLLGAIVWLGLIVTTAFGRDIKLPLIGRACARAVGLEEF